MTWWPSSRYPALVKPTTMFVIQVSIRFKKGNGYNPRCCEYKQNVKSGFSMRLPDASIKTSPVPADTHDDGYSRDSDEDHRPRTSQDFFTTDAPGLPTNAPSGTEVISYEFTAEQIVYSPGETFKGGVFRFSCECVAEDPVAKRGPLRARA